MHHKIFVAWSNFNENITLKALGQSALIAGESYKNKNNKITVSATTPTQKKNNIVACLIVCITVFLNASFYHLPKFFDLDVFKV